MATSTPPKWATDAFRSFGPGPVRDRTCWSASRRPAGAEEDRGRYESRIPRTGAVGEAADQRNGSGGRRGGPRNTGYNDPRSVYRKRTVGLRGRPLPNRGSASVRGFGAVRFIF